MSNNILVIIAETIKDFLNGRNTSLSEAHALLDRVADLIAEQSKHCIALDRFEIQSGLDRVRAAEGLIRQLPDNHDGRNTWLLNYGSKKTPREFSPIDTGQYMATHASVNDNGEFSLGLKKVSNFAQIHKDTGDSASARELAALFADLREEYLRGALRRDAEIANLKEVLIKFLEWSAESIPTINSDFNMLLPNMNELERIVESANKVLAIR